MASAGDQRYGTTQVAGSVPNKYGDSDWEKPDSGDERYGGTSLVSHCVERMEMARQEREERYEGKWREYTRIHRGMWTEKDKTADSERSKIIAPATMQAIDMTVSEMEEATFGRKAWFDVEDDLQDEIKEDAVALRDMLLEEFELNGVTQEISKCFMLGAIYGTGLGKINTTMVMEPTMVNGEAKEVKRLKVTLEAIRPDQFLIDPAATSIEEAEFCAHEMMKPLHLIKLKQEAGQYLSAAKVGPYFGEHYADTEGNEKYSHSDHNDNGCLITEFFGRVPRDLLPDYEGDESMPEAIVVIANNTVLLKAQASPYTMKDRPVIAFQHEVIPGEFYGRGVAEKAYNPQKALDSEMRGRIDALALMNAPMIGADITRLPRSPDMRVRPGKTIFTRGNPKEVFGDVAVGNPAVLANTFQQTSDLERMVSVATGAMDSAAPLNTNRRNETASGMSMMGSGFIKRAKRTMANVERSFLTPLIRKSLWRYMQFDPERFPTDYKFLPKATMGIMAKEVENAQLTSMLGFLEPQSPEYKIIVKAIFDNSSSANKAELGAAMASYTAEPSPEEQQEMQKQKQIQETVVQLQIKQAQADLEKTMAEIIKLKAEANKADVMADLEDDKVQIQAANAVTGIQRAKEETRKTEVQREGIRSKNQGSN